MQSRLGHGVSTLAAGLSDTEPAFCHWQCHHLLKLLCLGHTTALRALKTKHVAPNPVIYFTTSVSPWNVVCWPLVVIQATRDVACRTWKVKKENLLTPKGGATMVLDSGKTWLFKSQISEATVLCCWQIKVQDLILGCFILVSFYPAKRTEGNKEES